MKIANIKLSSKLVNLLAVAYLVFFSLPLILVWYIPMWGIGTYLSSFDPLAFFLKVLAMLFSPWALLAMAIASYRKSLKLQTYVATSLFLWAVLVQVMIVFFTLLLNMPRYYIRPFP